MTPFVEFSEGSDAFGVGGVLFDVLLLPPVFLPNSDRITLGEARARSESMFFQQYILREKKRTRKRRKFRRARMFPSRCLFFHDLKPCSRFFALCSSSFIFDLLRQNGRRGPAFEKNSYTPGRRKHRADVSNADAKLTGLPTARCSF